MPAEDLAPADPTLAEFTPGQIKLAANQLRSDPEIFPLLRLQAVNLRAHISLFAFASQDLINSLHVIAEQAALEGERLMRLHSLSEQDAARLFAQTLQFRGPYPLRPSSGLVEQQRLLARLRSPE